MKIVFATNNAHKLTEVQAVLGPGFRLVTPRECGVTGARMMGGGFGGCTINIVKTEAYDAYVAEITEKFEQEFGHKPRVIEVVISQGAHKIG